MDIARAERIFFAYRSGLLRCEPVAAAWRPEFDRLLDQILWCKLLPRERLIVRKIWDAGTRGLGLSRKFQWAAARAVFLAGWEKLAEEGLSPTAKLAGAWPAAARCHIAE